MDRAVRGGVVILQKWELPCADARDVLLVVQCVTSGPGQLEVSKKIRQYGDRLVGSPCKFPVDGPKPIQLGFRTEGEEGFTGSTRVNIAGNANAEVGHPDSMAAFLYGDDSYSASLPRRKVGALTCGLDHLMQKT